MLSLPLYVLATIAGVRKVYFLALLPVLYSSGTIDLAAIGWIGTLFVGAMIAGSLVVHRFAHIFSSKFILVNGSLLAILSTALLFIGYELHLLWCIAVSFVIMGFAAGVVDSTISAVVGLLTTTGARFKKLAELAMLKDVMRILSPLVIGFFVAIQMLEGAFFVIAGLMVLSYIGTFFLKKVTIKDASIETSERVSVFSNILFLKASATDFFDNFASSTLFVFVPLIFLARGFAVDDSMYLQSFIFAGYLAGRWLIANLATRGSGWRAVAVAECGMAVCIVLLLLLTNYFALVLVCGLLGVFTRGTSPVIKALAFDALSDREMKRGSAAYAVIGDMGAISGQFVFGILAAQVAVQAPFILSAAIALGVAFYCLRVQGSQNRLVL